MGSLWHLVKISEDFGILFSGFVIKCLFSVQLIRKRTTPCPQLLLMLSPYNLSYYPNSICFKRISTAILIVILFRQLKYNHWILLRIETTTTKSLHVWGKSSCGSLFPSHKPWMEDNFWFRIASLLTLRSPPETRSCEQNLSPGHPSQSHLSQGCSKGICLFAKGL